MIAFGALFCFNKYKLQMYPLREIKYFMRLFTCNLKRVYE